MSWALQRSAGWCKAREYGLGIHARATPRKRIAPVGRVGFSRYRDRVSRFGDALEKAGMRELPVN